MLKIGGKTFGLPPVVQKLLRGAKAVVATEEVRRKVNEVDLQVEEVLHKAGLATVDLKKLRAFKKKMGL